MANRHGYTYDRDTLCKKQRNKTDFVALTTYLNKWRSVNNNLKVVEMIRTTRESERERNKYCDDDNNDYYLYCSIVPAPCLYIIIIIIIIMVSFLQ